MNISEIKKKIENHYVFFIILLVYLVSNLFTLDKYRMVHDDEGILANYAYLLGHQGLSYIHPKLSFNGPYKDLAVVPLFGFVFFSTLTMLGKLIGYGLYQIRLQPLFFSIVSLFLTYKISLILFKEKRKAILACLLVGFQGTFVGMAHTIRPESMYLACVLGIVFLFLLWLKDKKSISICSAAFMSGASISIHANGVFLPVMLCLLMVIYHRSYGTNFIGCFARAFIFSVLGGGVFFVFDYIPHREYYWQMANAALFGGVTDSIHGFASIDVIRSRLHNIWATFFWETRYHRYMFYFVLYLVSLIGGIYFKRWAHTLLLLIVSYTFIQLLLLHESQFYFVYIIPFVSILLASTFFDFKDRFIVGSIKSKIFSFGTYGMMILYVLFPLGAFWVYRGYSYDRQIEMVKRVVGENNSFISADTYFFGFNDNDTHFSHYLLFQYNIKVLMKEMRIKYFVLDSASYSFFDVVKDSDEAIARKNVAFLNNECRVELKFNEYSKSIKMPSYLGNEVTIYNCGKAIGL